MVVQKNVYASDELCSYICPERVLVNRAFDSVKRSCHELFADAIPGAKHCDPVIGDLVELQKER